jgi:hypothetical protein
MIAHGHGDVKFTHYALDLYPTDLNHTIGLFARLLHDLEKSPSYSSILLFKNTGSTLLYEVVLVGKDVCMHSLPEPSTMTIVQKTIKVDMFFAYWSLLVTKCIFKEVFVSFLLIGHTHDGIDASFGR